MFGGVDVEILGDRRASYICIGVLLDMMATFSAVRDWKIQLIRKQARIQGR